MEENPLMTLLIYAGVYLIALLIAVGLLRWALRINQIVRNGRAHSMLLGLIAEKHGVPKEDINKILKKADEID